MEQDDKPEVRQRPWRYILGFLQLGVGILLLVVLIRQLPEGSIREAASSLPISHVLAALVLYWVASALVVSFNWWYLLSALGASVSLRDVAAANFSGLFYSSVIPSALSGDVARGARLYGSAMQHVEITLSLVIDRIVGLVIICTILAGGFIYYSEYMPFGVNRPLQALALLGVLAVIGLAVLYGIWKRFPEWLAPYSSALKIYSSHPFALLVSTLLTLTIHMLIAGMLWVLVRPYWETPLILYCLFMIELLTIAEMLPISVAGLGVREGLYVVMLEPFGVDKAEAIGIALTQFAIVMSVALTGGILEFFGNWFRLIKDARKVPTAK